MKKEKVINMSHKVKVEQPRLPRSLEEKYFQKVYDQDESYINACIIKDVAIDGEITGHIEFSQVIFKNVIFNDVSFENIVLTDVVFEKCDLSNTSFMGGNFHRVEFRESKMLGVNLAEASLTNVLFDNCNLNLSAFGYARFKQVKFNHCSMHSADCYECTFNNVAFDTCDLDKANLSGTPLKGIDLSNSTFQMLTLSLEDLYGCEVSTDQAIGFSKLLGLVIKE